MNDIIVIQQRAGRETVNARTLHMALEVGRDFSTWIADRVLKFGFIEGKDFEKTDRLSSPDSGSSKARPQTVIDYALSVAMAKELAMVENSDRGREVRQYLIQVEEAWNSPELVIARALQIASQQLETATKRIAVLEPKAKFYDAVSGSKDAVDLGTVAKILDMGVGRNGLFDILRQQGVLMEGNIPYQKFVDSRCFRLVETRYQKPDGSWHVNIKVVAFQKGIELCRRAIERSRRVGAA